MKLLVTGASGFLGRYTVAEALRQGHRVRAIVRPASDPGGLPWASHPNVEIIHLDLRSRKGLVPAVSGVDCIIHLAAARSGDFYARFASTVLATEHLVEAMVEVGINQIIAISTFAVYDFYRCPGNIVLGETAPIEPHPERRHAYVQTKLIQERLLRAASEEHDWKLTVIRPGAVFGKGSMWTSRLGFKLGDHVWVRTGARARLPLTYVENCAEAIVACSGRPEAMNATFNVVDDEQPQQRAYMRLLRDRERPRPRILPLNWSLLRFLAWVAGLANRWFLRGQARLPGLLIPESLHASCKPLRYSNRRLREAVGWTPRYALAEAIERSFGADGLSDFEETPGAALVEARSKAG